MTRWILNWGDEKTGGQTAVSSLEELDHQLDLLELRGRAAHPQIVDLCDAEDPDGPVLSIGTGADRSVAVWTVSEEGDGNAISRGVASTDASEWFEFAGEPTEYAAGRLIPPDSARQAARQFFDTGKRPTNLEWEAV